MKPFVAHLEKLAEKNRDFRHVLFTGEHAQLVLMSLLPGVAIGDEVHPTVDQFFRIEEGEARFDFFDGAEHEVSEGDAVIVPAGTRHNVINASATHPLKLYTVYSPPQHPDKMIQKTREQALLAEHH